MLPLRMTLLSLLPSLGATAGALVDERSTLGFSTWRSACRVDGVGLGSLFSFTWQLLPYAISGLLLGGLAVQILGWALRYRRTTAEECVATHLGCLVAMPIALLLCAQSMPVIAMPLVDALLAAAAALWVHRLISSCRGAGRVHP
jgi:hypothetical protein